MTLITTIKSSKELAFTAGDGRVNSLGTTTHDDVRKVFYNNDLCISFAGDTHVSQKLDKQNRFVPNIIEEYVDRFNGEDPLSLVQGLCQYLLSENSNLDLELFITTLVNKQVDIHYVNLQDGQIQTVKSECGILYSTKSGLSLEQVSNTFFQILSDKLGISEDELDSKLKNISENDVVEFLELFYKEIYNELNPLIDNTVGENLDIVVINKDGGKFHQKQNKSIKEIAKDQNVKL